MGEQTGSQLARSSVQVRAANAAPGEVDQHLLRRGPEVRDALHLKLSLVQCHRAYAGTVPVALALN